MKDFWQFVLFSASVMVVAVGPLSLILWHYPNFSITRELLICLWYSIFAAILWKLRRTIPDLIAMGDKERVKALQAAITYGVIAEEHPEKAEEFRTRVVVALEAMLSRGYAQPGAHESRGGICPVKDSSLKDEGVVTWPVPRKQVPARPSRSS
jgi:hypothetical protein